MKTYTIPALKEKRAMIAGHVISLKKYGLTETEASVANKLSRGTFAATFFLAALVALGVESVSLVDI